jgi:hypothetical protein
MWSGLARRQAVPHLRRFWHVTKDAGTGLTAATLAEATSATPHGTSKNYTGETMRRILSIVLGLLALSAPAMAQDTRREGALRSDGSIAVDIAKFGQASVDVRGTFSGTVNFEASTNGSDYVTVDCFVPSAPGTAVNSTTSAGVWQCPVAGLRLFRARMSSYVSGQADIVLSASAAGVAVVGAGGGGGGGDITISGSAPATDTGVITAATLRMTLATDDAAAVDLSDIAGSTSAAAGDLAYIRANLSIDAVSDQAALTQGPQVMALASAATPTAMSADGDAVRIWADLYGRLHAVWEGIEDAAETAGGYLSMAGTVRRDTAASSAGTAGDNATLNTDSVGRLWTSAAVVEDAAEAGADQVLAMGAVRRDAAASSSGASGDFSTVNVDALGQVWTRQLDPCSGVAKVYVPIDIVTATTTEVVGTASGASNYIYICSINLVSAGANNVALVEDDTDACASPSAGIAGGVTAAEGWNLAANGGLTQGNGNGSIAKSAAQNRYVCLITSAAVQLSGTIVYALAP